MANSHPLYMTWWHIKNRCCNVKAPQYKDYGGRGITVCDRWRFSFHNFVADMGPKPTPKHEIDRTNNSGNYEPGNCQWVLKFEQMRNRRDNILLTFQGKTQTQRDWGTELGINDQLISQRLLNGWSVERALMTRPKPRQNLLTFEGRTQNLSEWAAEIGITLQALIGRLQRQPLAEALFPNKIIAGGNRKLTDDQVRDLRHRRAEGESLNVLASRYGIAFGAVSAIANGHSYAKVK